MRILKGTDIASLAVKNKKTVISVAGGILVFFLLFFIALAPTRRDLAQKKEQWRALETQLVQARNKLNSFKVDKAGVEAKVEELRKRLPSKSPAPAILEELTKKGKQLNVDFISITPQAAEPAQQLRQDLAAFPDCEIMPVNIDMKARYKNLGEFLGAIEGLESSLATVAGFEVTKDEKTFPKLSISMKVYTYILKEAGSGQE